METWDAVRDHNNPPTLFCRGSVVVRAIDSEIEQAKDSTVRLMLSDAADWYEGRIVKGEVKKSDSFPPHDIVRAIVDGAENHLPKLTGIIRTPVFNSSERLIINEGYDAESGLLVNLNV